MSALISKKQLEAIARALIKRKSGLARRQRAGVTYLGQFISHDIVPASNPNRQSRNVTPYLNLDSIYGDNDEYLPGDGTFAIRPVRNDAGEIVGYDVPRERDDNGGYPAKIAEARNDDVLIVTQLHAFFQRLHNAVIRSGYAFDTTEAKTLTINTYQILMVEEFCKNILDSGVFTSYFTKGKSAYNLWDKSKIPAFFSKAAFRIGHSMVRPDYRLNSDSPTVRLSRLFTTNQKLDAEKAIEWELFFKEKLQGGQPAMPIDAKFASSMQHVRPIDGSFDPVNLIIRNLESGQVAGLPTGMEVAEQVYQKSTEQLLEDDRLWFKHYGTSTFAKLIAKNGGSTDIARLPLWPFVLIEAELAGGTHYRYRKFNECLGRVGSTLVAEVLVNAVVSSNESVFVGDKYDLDLALENMGTFGSVLRPKGRDRFDFLHLNNVLTSIERNHNND